MIAIDLVRLDREFAALSERRERAAFALSSGDLEGGGDPFWRARHLSTKASFLELSDLPDDPLVVALRGWVGHATLDRVTWRDRVEIARRWRARSHRSRLFDVEVSAHQLFRSLLGERESEGRRQEIARELGDAASPTSDAVRYGVERRREAKRLLGAPLAAGVWALEATDLASMAERALDVTREALGGGSPTAGAWQEAITAALGRDATEGWPARLGPRWLGDVFRGSVLVAGLGLATPALPDALGATSFARALGMYGRAIAVADLPRDLPFSIARAPDDPLPVARESLFALLAAEPAFGRRVLGLSRSVAREQARKVTLALAEALRWEALRPLVAAALVEGGARAASLADEQTARALGEPLPHGLLGVLPRLEPEGGRRLAGLLLGVADRRRLRENFDEDWFANPKAHEALRDEHHRPAETRVVTRERIAEALEALAVELGASVS